MEINNIFSVKRFILLGKRYLCLHIRNLLMPVLAVMFAAILIGVVTNYGGGHNPEVMLNLLSVFLFLMGYIYSSNMYKEVHSSYKSAFYQTLPASTLEKWLLSWLCSGPFFVIVATLIMFLSYYIVALFQFAVYQSPIEILRPGLYDADYLNKPAIYLLTQTIFLFGAIYFKKRQFVKTALWITAITLGVTLSLIGTEFLRYFIMAGSNGYEVNDAVLKDNYREFVKDVFIPIIRFSYYYLMAPFFLIFGYIKLKNKEL